MIEKYIPAFLDIVYKNDVRKLVTLEEIRDAFHTNQIISKTEAVNAFKTTLPVNVLYVGSWIGYLSYYLDREYPAVKFSEIDIDYRCTIFNRYFSKLPHYTADIERFPGIADFDTIINLSCEHMTDVWYNRLKPGTQVVLQSNDMKLDDHVNCCTSLEEMKDKYKLTKTTYESTLELNVMNRFTLAGVK